MKISSLEFFTAQHTYRDFGKAAAGNTATVAVWARFNEPVNQDVVTWPERGIPADWEQKRDRWEFAHATSALIHVVGMTALIIATLRDRR